MESQSDYGLPISSPLSVINVLHLIIDKGLPTTLRAGQSREKFVNCISEISGEEMAEIADISCQRKVPVLWTYLFSSR